VFPPTTLVGMDEHDLTKEQAQALYRGIVPAL